MVYWIMTLFFLGSIVLACGSSKKVNGTAEVKITSTDSITGLNSIQKNDCYTCHARDRKMVGPSFVNISARYVADEKTIKKLSLKIMKGGSGSWGNVPMTPHSYMTSEEVISVTKYIFSLIN